MSITPVYLSINTLDFPGYAGLPSAEVNMGVKTNNFDGVSFHDFQ
jgi:hypothetical protein